MKKIFSICFVLIISLLAPSVFAVEGSESGERRGAPEVRATIKQGQRTESQGNTLTRLKEKATKEIERRITSLTKLVEKIKSFKRLSSTQITDLTASVQAEITKLTTLKATILGQTDITALRTNVQSIVNSYRIYVLYIPKISIIANADKILNLAEGEMKTLTAKLQLRIDEAAKNGYSITELQTIMSQRQAKLTDAIAKANGAIAKVIPLTPDKWPANKTELQEARDMLQIARKDLNDAQKLANQVREKLKSFKLSGTPMPAHAETSPSPKPTESE